MQAHALLVKSGVWGWTAPDLTWRIAQFRTVMKRSPRSRVSKLGGTLGLSVSTAGG